MTRSFRHKLPLTSLGDLMMVSLVLPSSRLKTKSYKFLNKCSFASALEASSMKLTNVQSQLKLQLVQQDRRKRRRHLNRRFSMNWFPFVVFLCLLIVFLSRSKRPLFGQRHKSLADSRSEGQDFTMSMSGFDLLELCNDLLRSGGGRCYKNISPWSTKPLGKCGSGQN